MCMCYAQYALNAAFANSISYVGINVSSFFFFSVSFFSRFA